MAKVAYLKGASRPDDGHLKGGGGDGTSDDMDRRVNKLEDKVDKLVDRQTAVEINLATLTERVAHLPSKGFIVAATASSLAVIAALITLSDKIHALIR